MSCDESTGSCRCEPTRRDALRILGAAVSAALVPIARTTVMAGPFERADFEKLVPADKKLTPQWLKSLFERGAPAVYRGQDLKYIGMPVGGIGAGQLYLGGDGKLWRWDIFNAHLPTGADRYAHPTKTGLPIDQGFELRVVADGKTQTRTLDAVGFPDVSFLGQYPIGTIEYKDAGFPVAATLEAFSPFIPLNVDDSSLPATILRITLTNTSAAGVEATLAGWLQNAVLANDPGARATRRNRVIRGSAMTFLACSVDKPFAATAAAQPAAPDIVFEDWNKDDYDGWTVEGAAFGDRPAKRSEAPNYMGNFGPVGDRFVNSHASAPGKTIAEKDGQTGKLTSKPFTIERNFISFWIGGGSHKGKTCLNLLVEGKAVQSATGKDNDRMSSHSFDVTTLKGKQAVIEIVDDDKGHWGNIGIGRITFSDRQANPVKLEEMAGYGTMGLALLGDAPEYSVVASTKGGLSVPAQNENTSPLGGTLIGTIGRTLHLAVGQSATIDFVLTWHFPNLELENLGKVGRHYATKFDSAQAVAQYVTDQFARLSSQTKLWRDTWYDSTLPHWFLDRTLLNVSILATSTAYRFADGRFYAWEGVACCPGTCTHVWHYAHAMARLFPELERDTRERVDLKIAFHPDTGVMGFRAEFDKGLAVDGQAGTLLRCYREHQMSPDGAFLKRNWPLIKKAFDPLLKLDGNDDGVLEGAQMNTLDKPWFGKVNWLSSLYLAAIHAGEKMARESGDNDFADRCKAIAERGSKNLVDQLFDGEYFINKVDPKSLEAINSGTGCEIDQVFGQSWAFQVGLGRVLPEKQTRSALQSLWRYNFTPDVGPYRKAYKDGRWYAMAGEAGLLMCTFPRSDWDYENAKGKGPSWATGYFNECMNGFEHQVAGHMIWERMVEQGLAIERAIHDRYSPSRRNPWNEIECGDHYSRSMASYGVFLAACGYTYHGPAGELSFAPRLAPENFRAAFTTAQGWGTYEQERDATGHHGSIAIKWGSLQLRRMRLEIAADAKPTSASVSVDGKPVTATHVVDAGKIQISFPDAVDLQAGQRLEIVIT